MADPSSVPLPRPRGSLDYHQAPHYNNSLNGGTELQNGVATMSLETVDEAAHAQQHDPPRQSAVLHVDGGYDDDFERYQGEAAMGQYQGGIGSSSGGDDHGPSTQRDLSQVTGMQEEVYHDDFDQPSRLEGQPEYEHYHEQEQQAIVEGQDGHELELTAEERIANLEDELIRTREEKDTFEAQYRALLGKLTTMRNTLGDKLKQDADELDRRELEIGELRAANEDLASTVETLRNELIQTNDDAEHAHSELEQLRLRAFDSQKSTTEEAHAREVALRDAQEDLERVRMEREEWEGEAMRERVKREQLQARVGQIEMELGTAKSEREALREERDREAESAANLHAVLEEFQAAKDRELRSTLGDLQAELHSTHDALATFKQRALRAESELASTESNAEKVLALQKQVKDQSLLTGKLRHEAVILNEHLTEALRRLKKDSSEWTVDRRLVSNVLISFLNTPRGDTKRFEMLQLLSSILSWNDDQREQVGLQRSSGLSAPGVIASGSRGGQKGHARSGKGKAVDDGLGENESFSDLWIEFLLKESAAGTDKNAPSAGNRAEAKSEQRSGPTTPGSPGSGSVSPNGTGAATRGFILPDLGSPPLSPQAPSTRRPSFTSFFSRGGSRGAAADEAGANSSAASTVGSTPSIKE